MPCEKDFGYVRLTGPAVDVTGDLSHDIRD